ncbi:MAG TPA: ABC transporter six-transmembrane domain-containing protein, partial [Pirellulales bacterium]|nr:ABC transporter six-transmembrane domain-containing protein [Pirellulales bacterium]
WPQPGIPAMFTTSHSPAQSMAIAAPHVTAHVPGRAKLRDVVGRFGLLGGLARIYWLKFAFTYALFNLENLLRPSQPYMLSLAIKGLMTSSFAALWPYVAIYLAQTFVGVCRRAYDTRVFTGIYTDLATWLVIDQRKRRVEVSRVAARSALSRDFVAFFETDVTDVLWSLYSVVGALVVLGTQDLGLAAFCCALLVPAACFNWAYGRRAAKLNRRLNDQIEHEVDVIARERAGGIRRHFGLMAQWRIRLSNAEAANFGAGELCVAALLAASLVRCCTVACGDASRVLALFPYVVMFTVGLDCVPLIVQRIGRLRDIAQRIRKETDEARAWGGNPGLDSCNANFDFG